MFCIVFLVAFTKMTSHKQAIISHNTNNDIYLPLYHLHAFAMINIHKIQDRITELDLTKKQLVENSGLTRVTLDKILDGGEINVKSLEKLANGLGVNVGFFFDDNIADRGKQQIGDYNNRHASHDYGVNVEEHDELIRLRIENKFIKESIAEKDERISELKERIEELKAQLK